MDKAPDLSPGDAGSNPATTNSKNFFSFFYRIETDSKVIEMDSHPARTNGYLTGCLVQSISNQSALSIDELSRLV